MESNSVNFINDLKKEVNSHTMFNLEVQGAEIFIMTAEKSSVSCFNSEKIKDCCWIWLIIIWNFSESCFFYNALFPHIHCYVSKMDTLKGFSPFKITDMSSQPSHQALNNNHHPQECAEHNTGWRGNKLGSAWLSKVW